MGEARRRRLIGEAALVDTRRVADIISGKTKGVFGVVDALRIGPVFNGWFPTVTANLLNPIGLPLCTRCRMKEPHATAILASMPCDGPPDYGVWMDMIADGVPIEIVGDVVTGWKGTPPLVSCFFYAWEAPRTMTVPDRAARLISDHCQFCPTAAAESRIMETHSE